MLERRVSYTAGDLTLLLTYQILPVAGRVDSNLSGLKWSQSQHIARSMPLNTADLLPKRENNHFDHVYVEVKCELIAVR